MNTLFVRDKPRKEAKPSLNVKYKKNEIKMKKKPRKNEMIYNLIICFQKLSIIDQ